MRAHRALSGFQIVALLAMLALAPAAAAQGGTPPNVTPGPSWDVPPTVCDRPYDRGADVDGAQWDFIRRWTKRDIDRGIEWRDAQKIATAHLKGAIERGQARGGEPDELARSRGFDLSCINSNDEHAALGYDPKDKGHIWNVNFFPTWGRTGCVELSPGRCAGSSGGGAGGGPAGGSGPFGLPSPSDLAKAVLGAIDWKVLLAALLEGLWEVLVGDGIEQIGGEIATFLVKNPNLLAGYGGMGNVQGVVDALRAAAVFACIVAFTLTVIHFMAGQAEAPQAALGRLLAVLFALGFYRQLVAVVLAGSNAIAEGVATSGADTTSGAFPMLLKALVPVALPFWYLLSLVGSLLVIAIGVVKFVGFAFLLLTYAAGPLLLPLAIHPRTAGWVGVWAEHLVKALLWPTLWALEFRLFGALNGGLTLLGPGGDAALGTSSANALVALAMLVLMAYTPWLLHTRFTLRQGAQVVVQQVGRVADAAAVVATGGTSVTAKRAVASALATRRTGRGATGGG